MKQINFHHPPLYPDSSFNIHVNSSPIKNQQNSKSQLKKNPSRKKRKKKRLKIKFTIQRRNHNAKIVLSLSLHLYIYTDHTHTYIHIYIHWRIYRASISHSNFVDNRINEQKSNGRLIGSVPTVRLMRDVVLYSFSLHLHHLHHHFSLSLILSTSISHRHCQFPARLSAKWRPQL